MSNRVMSKRNVAWMGLLAGLLTGCGSSAPPPPPLVAVSGSVLMDGQPFPGCMVTFVPRGETKGQVAYGVTDAAGAFQLKYATGENGCPIGEYKAVFSKLLTPEGEPIPEGKSAADVGAVDKVPPMYRAMDTLHNVIQVPNSGKSDLKFELKSKR